MELIMAVNREAVVTLSNKKHINWGARRIIDLEGTTTSLNEYTDFCSFCLREDIFPEAITSQNTPTKCNRSAHVIVNTLRLLQHVTQHHLTIIGHHHHIQP